MWFKPRATMRQILNDSRGFNGRSMDWIAVILFVGITFAMIIQNKSGFLVFENIIFFLQIILVSVVGGTILLFLLAWFFKIFGKAFGGKASSRDLRFALSWSGIITIWTMVIFIPALLIFKEKLFYIPSIEDGQFKWLDALGNPNSLNLVPLLLNLIVSIMMCWSTFAFIKCYAEAERFSSWRAFAAFTLTMFSIFIIFGIIIGIAGLYNISFLTPILN